MSENNVELSATSHRRHRRGHRKHHHKEQNLEKKENVTLSTATQPCGGVEFDRENLAECRGCCRATFQFSCVILFCTLCVAFYVAAVACLFHFYNPKISDGQEEEKRISLAMGLSWFIFTVVVFVTHALLGNFGAFKTKQQLFVKWRKFLRWILPCLMYVLLWMPLILQQFESTKRPPTGFYSICWNVIIVFWCIVVTASPITFIAMCFLTVKHDEESQIANNDKDVLVRLKNWICYGCCFMSYEPCRGCGCDECE